MILKELNLVSFGKFSQEKIEFKDGLNIIYGENESGKTTIHNFIDGMFYGFLRPYVTRRYYLEEYEKYRPWNKDQYIGALRFSKDNRVYRIERNFGKGEVLVYDDLTGRDITKDIDIGEKIKVHLPGMYFFDFNNIVYKNTISIKQLENKIDSSLATEVKDRLANLSTSLDDDISVKEAMSRLDKKLEYIGSERAYTRPYGKAINDLNKLKDDRKNILKKQEEYNRYIDESYALKKEIEQEEDSIKRLMIKLEKTKILDKKKIYEETLNLKKDLKNIDSEIMELKRFFNLSFDDYTNALRLERDIKYLNKELETIEENKIKIEDKLNIIGTEDDPKTVEGIDVEILSKDYSRYEELEDEKNNNIINSHQNRLELLNSERNTMIDKNHQFKILGIVFLLLTLGSLGLGLVHIIFALLIIPLGGLVLYIQKSKKESEKKIEILTLDIEEIQKKEEGRKEKIIEIKNIQKGILLKYNCLSRSELKRLYDNSYMDTMDKRNKIDRIGDLKKQREEIIWRLKDKESKRLKLIDEINILVTNNQSETLEEFKEGLDKKRIYENLVKDKENKTQVLDKVLGNYDLESLEKELDDYEMNSLGDIKDIDKVQLDNEIKDREKELANTNKEDAKLEERIQNLNKDVKKLVEKEEEITKIKNLIESFQNKIEAIKLAKETINNISENIHDEFAPVINKDISEIMDRITDGKYNKVRIDDELNISVENPMTGEIIDIDSLSGGTMDQLYFALRFSIIGSMNGENLPLVLDDCFIQYDNLRLENILKILSKIGKNKQILLFTCHKREKQILDDLELEYNLINLS